jgi:hypothetical protein
MGAKAYKVVGPVAVIRKGKSERYVNRGAVLPADLLDEDNAEHLVAVGLIEPVEVAEDEAPEGEPTEEWTNKQLDAYAAAKGIDIKAAKTKADKLAAFAAAASA